MQAAVKPFLFVVACVALLASWCGQRSEATGLRRQLADQRDHRHEVEVLRREQARLRALPRPAGATARATPLPDGLASETWLPPGAWKNRGCATPAASVETMLWAAAGGEVATLGDMLHFDGAARARLVELFARLPADARARHGSPAELVAAVTMVAIPLGNAQMVWQHQDGPDEVEACVRITQPDYRPVDASTAGQASLDDLVGPTWRPGLKNIANFSLRRIDGSWRLVVPLSAIARIEKEVGGLK